MTQKSIFYGLIILYSLYNRNRLYIGQLDLYNCFASSAKLSSSTDSPLVNEYMPLGVLSMNTYVL